MKIAIHGPMLGKAAICEPILRSLPEWFGIEEANRQYICDIEMLPTFLAQVEGQTLGFLTLRQHNPNAAEIHVMGVREEAHHKGVGRALVEAVERYLRAQHVEYLQVKTLSPRHPDKYYARTRAFYTAIGFKRLEEFSTLWGEANPCLQMVKKL